MWNFQSGFKWLGIAGLIVVLDQISKLWIDANLRLYESIDILPIFQIIHVRNLGAAFSFLSDAGGWQRWFFVTISFVASIALTVWLLRLPKTALWQAIAITLILGGAVGNLIDRLAYGYVIDFLLVYYKTWHWPAFNVADSAITVGAIMLLIDAIKHPVEDS